MPKKSGTFWLTLTPRHPDKRVNEWLSHALRTEILTGRLAPGARLPSTRDLAHEYVLSRGTIVRAFEQLKSEGYLEGNIGSGTFVSRVLPEELLQVRRRAAWDGGGAHFVKRRSLSRYGRRAKQLLAHPDAPVRAFRANQPAVDLFPTVVWAQLVARRARLASPRQLLGCDSLGYRPLREAVADYLRAARGVNCSWEHIAIVSGVQDALDLVARVLLQPGDRVCMEEPGYIGASRVFDAYGLSIVPMPVDKDGATVPKASLRDVRLAYLTPAHQFPLGVSMSISRRLALLDWARRSRALIFEDDYDSEYRYSGHPLPALQGLDRHDSVLYAGSFSKVVFPALRLGYLVSPPDFIDPIAAAKSLTSRHAPLLEQMALCDFITENHFARHLRRMREVYSERHSVLCEAAKRELAGLLDVPAVEAGLQTVGWLTGGADARTASKRAASRDVEAVPLDVYFRGESTRQGLHLGFAAVDPTEIRRGVRELARALTT
jgi:GntR family transcriptional regulator/MocR family aminotransferase